MPNFTLNTNMSNPSLTQGLSDQKLPKLQFAKKQVSLSKPVRFIGVGLHSGKNVEMILRPAPVNTGYVFRIQNRKSKNIIKASYKNVTSTKLCTVLSDSEGNSISTVEHVLSACYALEIDNIFIDLDNNEIPVCDGSSQIFVDRIIENGFEEQSDFKKFIKIKKPVEVKDGNKIARVSPYDGTLISCVVEYPHQCIGKQSISLLLNPKIYSSQISSARTFGFLKDIKYLRSIGLTLGGNLDNAIVLDENSILNQEGLRFPDEFVRHKVLDFIGDISLAGNRIHGSFYSSHTGHQLNVKLVEKIFECSSNWELISSN